MPKDEYTAVHTYKRYSTSHEVLSAERVVLRSSVLVTYARREHATTGFALGATGGCVFIVI